MLEFNESFYRYAFAVHNYTRIFPILPNLTFIINFYTKRTKIRVEIFDKPILVFFIQWTTYEAGITSNILNA